MAQEIELANWGLAPRLVALHLTVMDIGGMVTETIPMQRQAVAHQQMEFHTK